MNKSPALLFSETYLHKLHLLTNMLDKAFDKVLRTHAGLTLAQFMLLIAVSEHTTINQRKIAHFLGVSPAAIKRQVDIAINNGWLVATLNKSPGQALCLTLKGQATITRGLRALESHLFRIFSDSNQSADLMTHVNLLLDHTKGVLHKQAISINPNLKGLNV